MNNRFSNRAKTSIISFTILSWFVFSLSGHAKESAPAPIAVPQFQSGDRWCAVGDSITYMGGYHHYVELFYVTRYPERTLDVFNCGIPGDTAGATLKRIGWDCLPAKPTIVSIMLGMNDIYRYLYVANADAKAVERRAQVAVGYEKSMRALTSAFLDAHVKVILIRPSIYDDTAAIPADNAPGLGAALAGFGDIDQKIADEFKLPIVDFSSPMMRINAEEQKKNPAFTIVGRDRVHPGPVGHMVMAYAFLKAQAVSGTISSVVIDAGAGKVLKAENCVLTELKQEPAGISFTLEERALPFPVDEKAQPALALVPFDQELNQEKLRVGGLSDSRYELAIDGEKVGVYPASDLAAGIDLGRNRLTPQYKQALAVEAALKKKWGIADKLRDIAYLEKNWDGPRPVTLEQMRPKLEEIVAKAKGKPSEDDRVRERNNYLQAKPHEIQYQGQVEVALAQVRSLAKPKPHRFVLSRLAAGAASAQPANP